MPAHQEDAVNIPRREALGILTAAAGAALLPGSVGAAGEQTPAANSLAKEKVTGIGGMFFRAHDPKALGQWYQEHLGITVIPQGPGDQPWNQAAGPTAFAPFPEKTSYFDITKQWMINFRVADLDKMVRQLESAGIAVKVDPTTYPNGRFAHTQDPEGNPIELWQPMKG